MHRFAIFFTLMVLFCAVASSYSATIHVPSQQPTIQAGINAAVNGDTVLVAPGVYVGAGNVDLNPNGRSLVLMGAGRDSTIIDCSFDGNDHRGIRLTSGEEEFRIVSLSIRNGSAPDTEIGALGGAVLMDSADVLIVEDCFMQGSALAGGAICSANRGLLICRNTMLEGTSGSGVSIGGSSFVASELEIRNSVPYGLSTWGDSVQLTNCTFTGNESGAMLYSSKHRLTGVVADGNQKYGIRIMGEYSLLQQCSFRHNGLSGISLYETRGQTIVDECEFLDNSSSGIKVDGESSPCHLEVIRCLFSGNQAAEGGAINCRYDLVYLNIDSSTFVQNQSPTGAAIFSNAMIQFQIERTILAYNSGSDPIVLGAGNLPVSLSCTDVYGNSPGDWVGAISNQLGAVGNFSADPMFCDIAGADFRLSYRSLCLPHGDWCNQQIGALGVGCGPFPRTYWVSPNGNDSWSGDSLTPLLTIQAAFDKCLNQDSIGLQTGIFSGPGNIGVFIGGMDIAVFGVHRDSSIIDAMGSGTCLQLSQGDYDDNISVSDITVRNGTVGIAAGSGFLGHNVHFQENSVGFAGRRHYSDQHQIADCEFNGNGTAINGSAALNRSVFNGNSSVLYVEFASSACFSNCSIKNTSGMIFRLERNLEFRDVPSRKPASGWEMLTLDSCVVEDNIGMIALFSGYYEDPLSFSATNTVFRNNGGGITASGGNDVLYLSNCLYIENGGPIYIRNRENMSLTTSQIRSCTIVENTGAGIHLDLRFFGPTNTSFSNNILFANEGPGLLVTFEDTGTVQVPLNCNDFYMNSGGDVIGIENPVGSNGNISVDPMFCDAEGFNFTLKNYSPCATENNDCASLIGAYEVGCQNAAPTIVSADRVDATEGILLTYRPEVLDTDGPSLSTLFQNHPSWLVVSSDSLLGTPRQHTQDTNFTIICSDGYLADTLVVLVHVQHITPVVDSIALEGKAQNHNVTSHTPNFSWAISGTDDSLAQFQFEIAVGVDTNWTYAEKWNPAPFASSDTFVTYDGSSLLDGQTYYLRLRVHNTLAWSDWYQTSFRMNSVPSVPALRAPTNLAVVGSTPFLWLTNGTDAQNDPLTYEFAGFHDTDCVAGPDINLTGVAQTSDSTGGQIVDPLAENCRYFWRARAFDGFEYSTWTDLAQFLVNGTPEAPTAPTLDYPPLPDNKPVFTLLPALTWQASYDPDPSDTVRYKLELSDRANFSFALVRDSLLATNLPLVDSLVFGTHYYWRVTSRDKTGLGAVSSVKEFWTWKLGDMNHSHSTDLSDLSLLIAYLVQTPRPDISPKMLADLTGDCKIDLSDLSLMISFMTTSGIQLQVGCE